MKLRYKIIAAFLLGISNVPFATAADLDALFSRGQGYEGEMQWEQAIAMYTTILEKKPEHAMAHYRLGVVWEKLGAMDHALREYKEALRFNPGLTEATQALEGYYVNQGIALRRAKQTDAAIAALQQALALNPASATAHLEMGHALDDRGQADAAIKEYQTALQVNPDYSAAHVQLAEAYRKQGQYEQALAAFQEVLRLNDRDPEAYHGIGVAYHELGQRDKAIESLQQAVRFYLLVGRRDLAKPAYTLQKQLQAEKAKERQQQRKQKDAKLRRQIQEKK
jgi:tetratricopeptide (TPR) repeat protein